MGLFFGNYNKPGPGVRKDAPKQKSVPHFFTILGRKYFELMKLNLLFLIPFAICFAIAFFLYSVTKTFYVLYLPIILIMPFISGLALITRNYTLEKHVFLLSDYLDCVKSNWKLFLCHGLVCYLILFLLSFSIEYYYKNSQLSMVYYVGFIICVAVAVLILFSQFYIPIMMVTFDLKLLQIYKNALIFAILGLWRNIFLTILFVIMGLVLYCMQAMIFTLILAGLFLILHFFSFSSYLINSVVYPLIDKTMIQPYQKKVEENEENMEEADQLISDKND